MTNILNYVLGGLLALAVVFGGTMWFQNNSLEKEVLKQNATITTLSVQKDALQANNTDLKKALDGQNASIAQFAEIQRMVSALFTEFDLSYASTAKQIASVKEAISKEKAPTTCKESVQYLRDARKEIK
jgi:hypothetical protein